MDLKFKEKYLLLSSMNELLTPSLDVSVTVPFPVIDVKTKTNDHIESIRVSWNESWY